jgi:hypothetical protein
MGYHFQIQCASNLCRFTLLLLGLLRLFLCVLFLFQKIEKPGYKYAKYIMLNPITCHILILPMLPPHVLHK